MTVSRRVNEGIIIDLQPLIDEAVNAAGCNGNMVRETMLTFLNDRPSIRIELVELRSTQAKIGIDAAYQLPILREELV